MRVELNSVLVNSRHMEKVSHGREWNFQLQVRSKSNKVKHGILYSITFLYFCCCQVNFLLFAT
jgi:hypothetical protein